MRKKENETGKRRKKKKQKHKEDRMIQCNLVLI